MISDGGPDGATSPDAAGRKPAGFAPGLMPVAAVTLAALILAACGESADGELQTGRTWVLTELGGQPPLAGTMIDMSLDGDGVSGTAGCNRYFGPASFSGGEISIGPDLASTRMACEEEVMGQESAFLAALAAAQGYEIAGDELAFLDGDSTVVARFELSATDGTPRRERTGY